MYARYVPPKKEAKAKADVSSTTQNIDRKSGLYARYVPPPKPTPTPSQKIVFEADEDDAEEERRPTKKLKIDVSPLKPKERKEKKEKKSKARKSTDSGTKDTTDTRDEVVTTDPLIADVQTTRESPEGALPSDRREKKKKKKDEDHKTAGKGSSNDTTADRHKSVLEKKEKSLKRLKKAEKDQEKSKDDEGSEPPPERETAEVHGLEPLPQPEPVPQDLTTPSYETLPPWLANPIRVSPKTRTPFSNIGISPEYGVPPQAEKVLRSKGWNDAFAVQTAAMPLLLPSRDRQGDLVISAATGSGKTLAYVLPMVRDISRGVLTKLRGLIVVPTRELVQQVQDVCETCSRAYSAIPDSKRVRIATAMGSQSFKKEQAAIMEEVQIYDPAGYEEYVRKRQGWPFIDGSAADGPDLGILDEGTQPMPYHVIQHTSKIDVLICTPGRLVEHINSTPGFTLDYVRWLIIDEADKLLGQSFQQWLDVVMEKLSVAKTNTRNFEDSFQSGVRKVVLSATMTTDLSLLNSLKLSRPRHVILEGTGKEDVDPSRRTEYALPEGLRESAIKIRDESQKPLYLVELLGGDLLRKGGAPQPTKQLDSSDEDPASSSEDEGTSMSDDDVSSTGSALNKGGAFPTSVLIFTKSNESALRLSRLLSLLAPELTSVIGTLTSTTRTSERRKTIRAFTTNKIKILVASDLTARGIDLPNLDHVVNYDMPPSAEVYVHRVGRTARADREGHAWTLFTKKEAGWFWPEVAGQGKGKGTGAGGAGGAIKRSNKVDKTNIGAFSDDREAAYEAALAKLGEEAARRTRDDDVE